MPSPASGDHSRSRDFAFCIARTASSGAVTSAWPSCTWPLTHATRCDAEGSPAMRSGSLCSRTSQMGVTHTTRSSSTIGKPSSRCRDATERVRHLGVVVGARRGANEGEGHLSARRVRVSATVCSAVARRRRGARVEGAPRPHSPADDLGCVLSARGLTLAWRRKRVGRDGGLLVDAFGDDGAHVRVQRAVLAALDVESVDVPARALRTALSGEVRTREGEPPVSRGGGASAEEQRTGIWPSTPRRATSRRATCPIWTTRQARCPRGGARGSARTGSEALAVVVRWRADVGRMARASW